MGLWRGVGLGISAAVLGSMVLGPTALASPPGSLLAGEYQNSGRQARFDATTPDNLQVSLFVTDGTHAVKLRDGTSSSSHTTELNFSISGFGVNGYVNVQACYLISPTDFTIASDLSSATLKSDITTANQSCGPVNTLAPPFGVNVTWTGTGPVGNSRGTSRFTCLLYSIDTLNTHTDNVATVSATLPTLSPLTSTRGNFSMDTEVLHVQGTESDACPPGGGIGRGAGSGPQPGGQYDFRSSRAGAFFITADRTFVSIFPSDSTNKSNPTGGVSSVTRDIEVSVQIFNFSNFLFENGCYVLTPADFAPNGTQSAVLNVTLLDQPTCPHQPFPNTVQLPLTINMTWAVNGPLTSDRSVGDFNCGGYTSHSETLNVANTATATGTVSGFPDAFSSDQGSLISTDNRIQALGVDPQACIFR
jgi:hypothetical protein